MPTDEQMKKFTELLVEFPTNVWLARASDHQDEVDEDAIPEVTVILRFSEKGFGFGEIALKQTQKGLFLDTECMSLERVKYFVNSLLDKAITDVEQDPERHKLYNEVMQTQCGDRCTICYPKADIT